MLDIEPPSITKEGQEDRTKNECHYPDVENIGQGTGLPLRHPDHHAAEDPHAPLLPAGGDAIKKLS